MPPETFVGKGRLAEGMFGRAQKKEQPGRRSQLSRQPDKKGVGRVRQRQAQSGTPSLRYGSYYSSQSSSEAPSAASERHDRLRPQETITMRSGRIDLNRTRLLLWLAIGVSLLVLVIWNITISSQARLTVVETPETKSFLNGVDTYQSAIDQQLAGYGGQFKWNVDAEQLETALLSQFPELSSVTAAVPVIGRFLGVTLKAAEPAFVVTGSNGKSWVVDRTGRAMSGDITKATTVPKITDQTGLSYTLGDQVLSPSEILFITKLINQFAAKQLSIDTLTLPAIPARLHITAGGQAYQIMFTFEGDVLRQSGAYFRTREQLDQQGRTPSLYVDVRVADRVYVK